MFSFFHNISPILPILSFNNYFFDGIPYIFLLKYHLNDYCGNTPPLFTNTPPCGDTILINGSAYGANTVFAYTPACGVYIIYKIGRAHV